VSYYLWCIGLEVGRIALAAATVVQACFTFLMGTETSDMIVWTGDPALMPWAKVAGALCLGCAWFWWWNIRRDVRAERDENARWRAEREQRGNGAEPGEDGGEDDHVGGAHRSALPSDQGASDEALQA
jgi:hypothetical protein